MTLNQRGLLAAEILTLPAFAATFLVVCGFIVVAALSVLTVFVDASLLAFELALGTTVFVAMLLVVLAFFTGLVAAGLTAIFLFPDPDCAAVASRTLPP